MSYVAIKGGEQAIENVERLLDARRRGDPSLPALTPAQIDQQLRFAVDRVMSEGSLYDRELAALAVKQSAGDLVEAAFLVRSYRTTLPRLCASVPLVTDGMRAERRISSIFKDIPGGQFLGPTHDYTHRLLDFKLAAEGEAPDAPAAGTDQPAMPRVMDTLARQDLIQEEPYDAAAEPFDLTQKPPVFPLGRDARLQNLARGDEGFLLSLAYAIARGYGTNHPFVGEIRMGEVDVSICPEELGFEVVIGAVTVTEVQMVEKLGGPGTEAPRFSRGYGLTFGHNERKAMSMALVERALRSAEMGEPTMGPAQDEEFVTYHSDNVAAQGFVQHLKLPHYIDFQAEMQLLRALREERSRKNADAPASAPDPSTTRSTEDA